MSKSHIAAEALHTLSTRTAKQLLLGLVSCSRLWKPSLGPVNVN
jgi:hypothetical protein